MNRIKRSAVNRNNWITIGHFLIECPAYSCNREEFRHLRLHSFTDVAKLFNECTDCKELAKFMVLCRELRSKLVRR
jgi:hypothetical protein